jgi:uracil-DNA glycosylase
MSGEYHQLLEATIAHLERLRAHGTRFVPVSAAALEPLMTAPVPARPASPTASRPRLAAPTAVAPTRAPAALEPPVSSSGRTELLVSPPAAPAPVARPALSPEAKAAAFNDLRQRALACVRCPNLVRSRRNVVFGVGDPDAELMFVGEAPGADEDAQGEPFVGAAGQLLTRIIQTMGLARDQVYIANILKCRPDTPGQSSGNRKPTPAEMATCIPWLHEQIDLIRPRVLVALGGTAVEGLLGATLGIMKLRGHWREYRGIPLMPTYHPAYLLRNQALSEKRKVWEDMLAVLEKLGRPISDKQRNYFLKS